MNPLKRIWFYYGCLSRLDRIYIEAKCPQDKGKRDQLMLDVARENKLEGRPNLLSKFWWTWGMIITISVFSWALFRNYIRESTGGGIVENIFPFFVIVGASYFISAAYRDFWWKHIPSCPKHNMSFVCLKCREESLKKIEKLDREMEEKRKR